MVPVRTENPIAAIGNYWATQRMPTDTEVRLLQALANSTSVALENAQLYSALEERVRERTAALEVATRAEEEMRHELAERKRAEAALEETSYQLRQSQKMEAIGQLAGGVAHDFNNILTVILSCASLAREDLSTESHVREDLDEIYKAGQRAASLTHRLLAFSRQQVMTPSVIDVGEVARGMQMMLTRLVGSNMELELFVSKDLHPVFADAGQLEQVLLNLVVNARDAMQAGGKITVEATNVQLQGEYTSSHAQVQDGDYVMLAVSDTGMGMDKETQARIFEPFFTTKEKGKGTGLGLSTVYGIVKQSGGHIWVYSEPGEGTTFKVYLPVCVDAPRVRTKVALPRPRGWGGTETILLVEDDEQVRAVVRGILRRNGYQVIETRAPSEAIAAFNQHPTVDLLLTDVIMPEMAGTELARRLRAIRTELKLVCMSGYTGEATVRHGYLEPDVPFVQKPLTPEALLHTIRQALDIDPHTGLRRSQLPGAPQDGSS
jgi:signal transduction histidine kinase/ActR/RegA family two-component response regulator